jgi:hypothetical protein
MMKKQRLGFVLSRAITGCAALLAGCAADGSQTARQEGIQAVMKEIQATFDELARPTSACISGRLGNDKTCEPETAWKDLVTAACEARGMSLESLSPADRCAADQLSAVNFSCCPKSEQASDPNCTSSVLGGPTGCRSTAEWKEAIVSACAAQGRLLTDAYFGASCGADAVRSVSYACCSAQPAPEPATDCQSFVAGGAGTCRTAQDWKTQVTADCSGRRLQLSDLSLSDGCETEKFSSARYLCCGARPTPPPAPSCESKVYGASSCQDEAAWRLVATDLCTTQGLTLDAIAYSESCGSSLWRNMKYACCPSVSTPPPDPPPPSTCATQLLGDGTACTDQATWRDQAIRTCAAASQQLSTLSFGPECGAGKYTLAKALCCK